METTTIQKWGNSHGIRIPQNLLNSLKWQKGEKITMSIEGNRLLIEQAPISRHKNIKELFKGFNIANYMPQEIDWGKPTGGELW